VITDTYYSSKTVLIEMAFFSLVPTLIGL